MLQPSGQDKVLGILSNFVSRNQLPQSLIFAGPPGVGRKTTALWFACALNCTSSVSGVTPCGACPSCKKISRSIHPDIQLIAPLSGKQRKELRGETPQDESTSDKKSTTIDDIRDLIKRSYQKPLEGLRKVYIITDAGKMTPGAAICLLKTLEEPPPNVTFILVAEAPSALPPTLVSRCQILTFSLLPEELIINRLIEEHRASPEEAARAASLSAGSLGKAIKLMENEVKRKLREDSLNFAGRLSSASLYELIESAPQWAPEPRKKKKAGAAPEDGSPQDAEEDDPEDKNESLLAFLEYLLGWFRDILVLQEGAPERLVMNRDRLPILSKCRGILNRSHIMEIISLILESNSQLKGNANGRLLLQNLFVKINEKLRIIEEM